MIKSFNQIGDRERDINKRYLSIYSQNCDTYTYSHSLISPKFVYLSLYLSLYPNSNKSNTKRGLYNGCS